MSDRGSRSAFVVGAGILISRVVGLLRQTAFAHFFGAGDEADAFNVAQKIPNAIRNLLGEGTVAAAFVPVYSGLIDRDERASRAMANAVLGLLFGGVAVLTITGILAAPLLTRVLALGYADDPAKLELITRLTRVLFPMAGLMVLSGWCLGVQNAHRRFFWSYASAALWSIAQIVLLVGFGNRAESLAELAWWLAWATLAGSILQIGAQLPEVFRLLGSIKPSFDRFAEGVQPVMRNMLPVLIAVGVVQISGFIDQFISTFLPSGAFSNLNYANTIAMLPVSLFGISVVASSLPDLSRDSASANLDALRERLRVSWLRILFYIVPSSVALAALGDYCGGLIYRSGRFGADEQRVVHFVLAGYAFGLMSFASVRLIASAFYALQDYRTPLRASLASLVVSGIAAAGIAFALRDSPLAPAGIAVGSALGSYANFSFQSTRLRRRLGPMYTAAMWTGTWRILIAAVTAAAVTYPMRMFLDADRPRLTGPIILAAFGVTYLLVAWWLGSGEAARLLRLRVRNRTTGAAS